MIPATKQHGSLQRPAGSELLQLWAAECFFPAGGMESGNNGGTAEHSLFQRPDFFRAAKLVQQDKLGERVRKAIWTAIALGRPEISSTAMVFCS